MYTIEAVKATPSGISFQLTIKMSTHPQSATLIYLLLNLCQLLIHKKRGICCGRAIYSIKFVRHYQVPHVRCYPSGRVDWKLSTGREQPQRGPVCKRVPRLASCMIGKCLCASVSGNGKVLTVSSRTGSMQYCQPLCVILVL